MRVICLLAASNHVGGKQMSAEADTGYGCFRQFKSPCIWSTCTLPFPRPISNFEILDFSLHLLHYPCIHVRHCLLSQWLPRPNPECFPFTYICTISLNTIISLQDFITKLIAPVSSTDKISLPDHWRLPHGHCQRYWIGLASHHRCYRLRL